MSQSPKSPAPKSASPRRPRPNPGRPRTGARVAAVQALFQSEAGGESAETVIDQFVRHRIGLPMGEGRGDDGFEDGRVPQADVPLFSRIVRGAAKDSETIDAAIAAHLSGTWTLDRLDPVLRALLRAAAAELWAGAADTPARVVINEYMDIAHGFFDAEEPRFANGVLDALARQMRGDEFQPRA